MSRLLHIEFNIIKIATNFHSFVILTYISVFGLNLEIEDDMFLVVLWMFRYHRNYTLDLNSSPISHVHQPKYELWNR